MSPRGTAVRMNERGASDRARNVLGPLNLHLAVLAVLLVLNLYLLAHLFLLWQRASSNNASAVAQQQIALRAAEVSAQPLKGLDQKLADATKDADNFYQHRFPSADSEVLSELGTLTKAHNVRLTRGQYVHAPVLADTSGEVTQMSIDASLSGDYGQLVQFINALERDRMFFLIDAVSLSGQDSGTVNLRLRLRTFLRGHVEDQTSNEQALTTEPANEGAQP